MARGPLVLRNALMKAKLFEISVFGPLNTFSIFTSEYHSVFPILQPYRQYSTSLLLTIMVDNCIVLTPLNRLL